MKDIMETCRDSIKDVYKRQVVFISPFPAYTKVRKERWKRKSGKIFWTDIVFYWSWNGDRNVDFRQRDHNCGRNYVPPLRVSSVLPVSRCGERNFFMPVFLL